VQRGFTIIELMIVIVIIGIMSSLAIPYYMRSSARAYRSESQVVISKLELYFKNVYENNNKYSNQYILEGSPGPDVMPDPNGTIPVGVGTDWKPVAGHGWDDLPFPPEGNIRMRYLYLVDNSTTPPNVTIQACGNFPGFGAPTYAFGSHGVLCNYLFTEIMRGLSVDTRPGSTDVSELPQSF
jgi:prepilin-type N-terminal cleavage/methylation domain-containing protein